MLKAHTVYIFSDWGTNACTSALGWWIRGRQWEWMVFLQTPPSSRLFQHAADHPSSQAFPLPLSPLPLLRFPSPSTGQGREEGGRTQEGCRQWNQGRRPTRENQLGLPVSLEGRAVSLKWLLSEADKMKSRLSYSLKEMVLIDKCLLESKGANLELSQWFHLNTYSAARGPWPAAQLKKQEIHIFAGALEAEVFRMLSFLKR